MSFVFWLGLCSTIGIEADIETEIGMKIGVDMHVDIDIDVTFNIVLFSSCISVSIRREVDRGPTSSADFLRF